MSDDLAPWQNEETFSKNFNQHHLLPSGLHFTSWAHKKKKNRLMWSTAHIDTSIFKLGPTWSLTSNGSTTLTKCLIRGRLFPWRTGQAIRHPCRLIWRFPGLLIVVSDDIFILPFNGYTMETLAERLWSSFCWKFEVSSLSLLPDHSKHFRSRGSPASMLMPFYNACYKLHTCKCENETSVNWKGLTGF